MKSFESINAGYNRVFQPSKLSLGLVVPIETYSTSPVPKMTDHLERVKLIDQLGFRALWIRDIPFNVPTFGDAGQLFDPFTYLGFLSGQTHRIALGVSIIALPLHHPLHVAKAAASIDQLSGGRMILGVASGDRPQEYPAMNVAFEKRGELFREAFDYIRNVQHSFPFFESDHYGTLHGQADVLPKATGHKLPLMLTGSSRQTLEWNAKHADGWMSYPRNTHQQAHTIDTYRSLVAEHCKFDKPFMQPLYLDLSPDDDFQPQPIHRGLKTGVNPLIDYLHQLQEIGVNHVAFNLRFNTQPITETLHKLADEVLPSFHKTHQEVIAK
ncbi:MAG: LLM class oxidoreductase [Bacteroidota bacterium]